MKLLNIIYSTTGYSFIIADLIQLIKLINSKDIIDFEIKSWFLFISTNLSGFIFSKKIYDFNIILAYLGPVIIDTLIIAYAYYKRKEIKNLVIFLISISFIYFIYFSVVYSSPDLIEKYGHMLGIYPAIVLPLGVFLQLFKIVRKGGCNGVSIITWTLQFVGLFILYFLLGKGADIVAIFNSLVPSFLSLLIILYCTFIAKN